LIEIGSISSW